jgi:hypothetical protein
LYPVDERMEVLKELSVAVASPILDTIQHNILAKLIMNEEKLSMDHLRLITASFDLLFTLKEVLRPYDQEGFLLQPYFIKVLASTLRGALWASFKSMKSTLELLKVSN